MKRNVLFTVLALAVLAFAVVGWTVQGARWAFAAPARSFG
jgi:hypothetical protein